MTILPTWPSSVPLLPLRDSVNVVQTAEPPLVSEMNSGTTRRRRKFTIHIAKMQFTLVLTAVQAQYLQSFYEATLGDGAARFSIPLIWRGQNITRNCVFAQPIGFSEMTPNQQRVSVSLLIENL